MADLERRVRTRRKKLQEVEKEKKECRGESWVARAKLEPGDEEGKEYRGYNTE